MTAAVGGWIALGVWLAFMTAISIGVWRAQARRTRERRRG